MGFFNNNKSSGDNPITDEKFETIERALSSGELKYETLEKALFSTEVINRDITPDEITRGASSRNTYSITSDKKIVGQNTLVDSNDVVFLDVEVVRFKIERVSHWIIVGGTKDSYTVFGLGTKYNNSYTHQLVDMIAGKVSVKYAGTLFAEKIRVVGANVDFGDEVEIINSKTKITVNIRKPNVLQWTKWFDIVKADYPACLHINNTKLGFAFGISGAETKGTNPANSAAVNIPDVKVLFKNIVTNVKTNFDLLKDNLNDRISTVESNSNSKPNKKYAVVIVAGQSNAVGYDESPVNGLYNGRTNPRIKQLGYKGGNNLKIVELTHCAENYEDMATTTINNSANVNTTNMGTKGMHLPLGNLISKDLPEDFDVLFIPCAYGGTGFVTGAPAGTYDSTALKPSAGRILWGVNSPYYWAMRDRLKKVLNDNPGNIFLGVIWIQGENDSANAAGHLTAFTNMTNDFFAHFNNNGYGNRTKKGTFDKDLWFNVETVAHWYTVGQCQQIWDNYKTWNANSYIEIPRNTDSNVIGGTANAAGNKATHFGNDAFSKVIAPLIYVKLKNNI